MNPRRQKNKLVMVAVLVTNHEIDAEWIARRLCVSKEVYSVQELINDEVYGFGPVGMEFTHERLDRVRR